MDNSASRLAVTVPQQDRTADARAKGSAIRFLVWAAMLLLAAVPGVGAAVPAVFLVGMASILYMTATTAILQVEARPEMHGRVLALQTVLMGGSAALGGPLLGWIADSAGARSLMVIGGLTCLAAAGFGALASHRHESRRPTVLRADP